MLFPYSTDAPVNHFPYGTIGLIVANVVMFCVFCLDGSYEDTPVGIQNLQQPNVEENWDAPADNEDVPFDRDDFAVDINSIQDPGIKTNVEAPEQALPDGLDVQTIRVDGFEISVIRSQAFSRNLVLDFADGLKPWQWLSSAFMHDGWLHLIGNMVFLWSFGLVVEGKIGALLFLPIYAGIAAVQGCLMQVLMLFSDGGFALGATSAIFGLLAIVVIWAPVNEFGTVLVFYRIFLIEIPHLFFGFIYVMLNVLSIYMTGTIRSSAGLHMTGFLVGLPVGYFMLTKGFVDCEGYDLVSYFQGKQGKEATVGKKEAKARRRKKLEKEKQLELKTPPDPAKLEALQLQVREAINEGELDLAIRLQMKLTEKHPALTWRQADLKSVIATLLKHRKFDQAFPLIEDYIKLFPQDAFTMQTAMAKVWLQQERPKHTLRFLKTLDLASLDETQREVFKKLIETAKEQIASGVIEI